MWVLGILSSFCNLSHCTIYVSSPESVTQELGAFFMAVSSLSVSYADVDGILQTRCEIVDILLEMDRILRPEGAVLMRDEVDVLNKAMAITQGMRWECRLADHEDGPFNLEKILVCVKTYWVGEYTAASSDSAKSDTTEKEEIAE